MKIFGFHILREMPEKYEVVEKEVIKYFPQPDALVDLYFFFEYGPDYDYMTGDGKKRRYFRTCAEAFKAGCQYEEVSRTLALRVGDQYFILLQAEPVEVEQSGRNR